VGRLIQRAEPIDIDVSRPGGEADSFPVDEKEWLLDAGVRLLVPVMTDDDSLVGVLALGEKLSGLPYTAEDRLLLTAMTTSVSQTAARAIRVRDDPDARHASDEAARKCLGCGRIVPSDQGRCTGCGDSTVPTPAPLVLAGKFRLLEQLGAGGMGVVYKAEDVELHRLVAIKTLPGVAPAGVAQLRREARAMASVTHPNLAVIHGAESWRGVPMLVIEYLPGGTLADRLRVGPVPVDRALEIAAALAAGLERLHASGLIHGDVKPSNVGFNELDQPKLLDFGLVRAIDASMASSSPPQWRSHRRRTAASTWGGPRIGATSALVGTPLYFSPEQVQGRKPDVSTDLWALGTVVYEALAGRHPLAACGLDDLLARISAADLPDIRAQRGDLPDGVAELLRQTLDPDPHRRPRSARELRERIVDARRLLGPPQPAPTLSHDVAPLAPSPPVR
jgi:serine/threonine protein kinase